MHRDDYEAVARRDLAEALDGAVEPEQIGLDDDLYTDLGLTSINKVMLVTSLCDDLAAMTSLRTVLATLERHDPAVAS